MEVTLRFTAKQIYSWISLLASLLMVFAIFFIFTTSTDRTGAGMVFAGLAFMLMMHFYLLFIPIIGLCLDVYYLRERQTRNSSLAEYMIGTSTSFLLFIAVFILVLKASGLP